MNLEQSLVKADFPKCDWNGTLVSIAGALNMSDEGECYVWLCMIATEQYDKILCVRA